jgi:hypothetical protein
MVKKTTNPAILNRSLPWLYVHLADRAKDNNFISPEFFFIKGEKPTLLCFYKKV